ncbi:MAG: tyrosine-type recombinase/integrase [Actinomycetia bacterium]|nr:tyrosine-type recombinase/integrase [Actinomycetes bacterium]
MPFKHRGAWHDQTRAYLNSLRPKNPPSDRGVVRHRTIISYKPMLWEGGELLGFPNPNAVTLEQMRTLEGSVRGDSERTIGVKCYVIRAFLRWCGNLAAQKWKIHAHPTPYRGGIFLNERQVAKLHQRAHELGPTEELVTCLAVDMGLRCVDIENLTLENARNFLDFGEDEILGKGRNGGKVALQTFNDYVREPLLRYLRHRAKMVEETKDHQCQKLVVRPVKYKRRSYLAPLRWEHYHPMTVELSKVVGVLFSMHDLRRTLGNRLWKRGVPIETIAKVLRHEDCGMTFRAYIGVDSSNMRDALNSLNETRPGTPSQSAARV